MAVVAFQALQRKFLQSFYKFDNSSMSSLLGHIPWESNILGESVPMFEKHHSKGVSTPGPTRACALVNLTCALVNS